MILIQKYRIENGANDVTGEAWLLTSDSLNGTPFHITLNVARYFELAVGWKSSINLQKPFL